MSPSVKKVAYYPRSQRSKTRLHEYLFSPVFCNENLSPNNRRSSRICVCFCLGPRSLPTHSPTHEQCVCCREMSHMLCIRDSQEKEKKKKNLLPSSRLGEFSLASRYFSHQKQAFGTKLNPIESFVLFNQAPSPEKQVRSTLDARSHFLESIL